MRLHVKKNNNKQKEKVVMDVTLASKANFEKIDYSGWLASEKLDGFRALFFNGTFISRNDKEFVAPEWFTEQFKNINMVLDGELYLGKNEPFELHSKLKKKKPDDDVWKKVTYHVFDYVPINNNIPFKKRYTILQSLKENNKKKQMKLVKQTVVKNNAHVQKMLLDVVANKKCEGLILRNPDMLYEKGRTKNMVKVKSHHEAEAVVVKHEESKNVVTSLGCFLLKDETAELTNTYVNISAGLTKKMKTTTSNLPQIGSIITIQYNDVTQNDVPRFARFVRVREDMSYVKKSEEKQEQL